MLKYAIIGAAIVAITVIIHAIGTMSVVRLIGRRYARPDGMLHPGKPMLVVIGVVVFLLALHSLEIMVWAVAYVLLLPAGEMSSFEESVYFSFVTFTTLGYGDVTITRGWRLLAGIQALNGILLAGWSTAMLFAFLQRMWHGILLHPTSTGQSES